MNPVWKERAVRVWRNYLRPFLFIAVLLTAFRSSIADWNDVPTGSMKPTILEGDRVFVNKLAYDLKVPFTTWHLAEWSDPQRGDIVVFFSPMDGTRLVKRVVAVPGDVVAMRQDKLIINGVEATWEALDPGIAGQLPAGQRSAHALMAENLNGQTHPVMITPSVRSMRSFEGITLGEGEYFMLGDNRDNSLDSRYFGPVERKLIVGRASAVVLSLDLERRLMPRWERFFTALP